jgi:hypothetical protein
MNFKTLIIISFSIISSQLAFAVELPISCEFNHHAFALYNDGTGKAVDNQEQMVATKFDFKSPNPVTSTIAARTFQVYTECLIVSHQGATALAVPAIHMAIMDPISKSIQETDIRLDVQGQVATLTSRLDDQPPVASNENSRIIFWSIGCRWSYQAVSCPSIPNP